MELSTYQETAQQTAIYPKEHAIDYLMAGLGGEVGELLSLYAKSKRGDVAEMDISKASKELGDILWFISELSRNLGLSLEDVALENLKKLSSRKERGLLKGSGDER